jgi:hypothetical protein
MTRSIQHQIEIDAPPAVVWEQLADTNAYPEWNPFVRRLTGELHAGATLTVRIAPPGGRAMTFRPTVLAAEIGRELRWRGRLLIPGLFDGEHSFRLEPLPGGRTRLIQSERFRGLLVGLSGTTLQKTRLGFEQMNHTLKLRAEAAGRTGREARSAHSALA